jgi:LacI family transcriptional regulator, repressor for deo operon, udp, cdd, tsx, nupC, and nupG
LRAGTLPSQRASKLDILRVSAYCHACIVSKALPTRPTIKDVARAASVSQATVSYVLNNSRASHQISEGTKRRIWAVVERLGYRFNPIGRALQRGHTSQVTLMIVSWNLALSHAATAMAISRAAAAQELALTVHVADDDQSAEEFIRRNVLHHLRGVLVLWDSPAFRESSLKQLAAEGTPIIDLLPDGADGISVVTVDREAAFFRGTQHLIELGHRQIGIICDSIARPKTTLRKLAGYRRALKTAGIPYRKALVQNVTEFGFEGGQRGGRELLRRCPGVTALCCINDAMALGAIEAADELGRQCPTDLSVIGFGDSAEGRHWRPKLTTFELSPNRVATEAIRLILEQQVNRRVEPKTVLIPEELIVRESTGRAPNMEQRLGAARPACDQVPA